MADKLMYIPNDDTQNILFYRLKLMVATFKHLTTNQQIIFTAVPKVVKPTNKKPSLSGFSLVSL